MIKSLLYGICGSLFCLLGFWIAGIAHSSAPQKETVVDKSAYEVRKAGSLNVPVLRQGKLYGYIVVQLAYALNRQVDDIDHTSVESLLQDEAFRTLYSDQQIDWRTLEKYDLNALTKKLLTRVKERIPSEAIQDILIREFSFVPATSLR